MTVAALRSRSGEKLSVRLSSLPAVAALLATLLTLLLTFGTESVHAQGGYPFRSFGRNGGPVKLAEGPLRTCKQTEENYKPVSKPDKSVHVTRLFFHVIECFRFTSLIIICKWISFCGKDAMKRNDVGIWSCKRCERVVAGVGHGYILNSCSISQISSETS
nr:unnamed protein product [Callosobruchus chinensis]